MEKPLVGDVVAIPFPFSDLSGSKLRPALVVAGVPGNDVILCQITSRARPDQLAVAIDETSFESGGLPVPSLVRCGKVFTADASIVQKHLGQLKKPVSAQIVQTIQSLLGQNF